MATQAQQVNISQLPPASLLYNGDVFAVDQIGGDGYTKQVRFSTLCRSISSIILPDLYNTKVSKSGDTMTGRLTLAVNPINALDAATKQYVDTAGLPFLNKSGGTMTGRLTLAVDPVNALEAATKQYVDTVTGTNLEDIWMYIKTRTYPVGEIFITHRNGDPSTILGFGTWERYAEGRVLVGYKADDPDFSGLDNIGGAKTHTLTVNEIPPHTHALSPIIISDYGTGTIGPPNNTNDGVVVPQTQATGGGQPHDNLQPYITVYMWERIG